MVLFPNALNLKELGHLTNFFVLYSGLSHHGPEDLFEWLSQGRDPDHDRRLQRPPGRTYGAALSGAVR